MFDISCRSPDGLVKQRTLGCVGSVILGRRGLGFRVWGSVILWRGVWRLGLGSL